MNSCCSPWLLYLLLLRKKEDPEVFLDARYRSALVRWGFKVHVPGCFFLLDFLAIACAFGVLFDEGEEQPGLSVGRLKWKVDRLVRQQRYG